MILLWFFCSLSVAVPSWSYLKCNADPPARATATDHFRFLRTHLLALCVEVPEFVGLPLFYAGWELRSVCCRWLRSTLTSDQSTIGFTPKIVLHSQSANYSMSTEFMHSISTWIINYKFHIITIFIALLSPTTPHSSATILLRYQLNEIFPISEIPRIFWFGWKWHICQWRMHLLTRKYGYSKMRRK